MKLRKWTCILFSCIAVLSGYAQFNSRESQVNYDGFKNLQIAYSKTTSIVFPYAIKSIDKGSPDVLLQKAKGVENVLLLKAAKQNFTQTNLTVVTADSRLYVFVLNYDEACPHLNIKADQTAVVNGDILFAIENENQKKIEQYAGLALSRKKETPGLKRSRYEMRMQITGVFIHQEILYFRVLLGNTSRINYNIDQLRFFIRDQKKSKRTATQEIEVQPLFSTSSSQIIPEQSELSIVYALPKFTIPEKKYLTVQLIEKNGGRQVEVDIGNKNLIDIEILNNL